MQRNTSSFRITVSGILLLVGLLFITACRTDKNKFSSIPFLRLEGAYVYNNGNGQDSFILLSCYFRDGDGDIGLKLNDTFPPFGPSDPYYHNLLVWMYVKQNGQWIKPVNPLSPDNDTLNFHERLESLTPTGRAKWIEGYLDLRIPAEPFSLKPDTIYLAARLTDRKLNHSEWIKTEEIILQH